MSEPRRDWPAGLPLAGDAPVFTPPDPAALLHRGRHVRRVHAFVAGAAAVLLLAMGSAVAVNATSHRAGGSDVVTPAIDRTPSPSASPQAVSSPQLPAISSSGAGIAAPATIPVRPSPAGSPVAAKLASPTMAPLPAAPTTATPFRRTTVRNPPTQSCLYQPITAPSGWCLDYVGPSATPAGVPVDFNIDICRINRFGSGTRRFATGQEADVSVLSQGKRSWRWSHGRDFSKRSHTLTASPGECIRWTTTWTTEDNSGRLFPPGSYSLGVQVMSPDADLPGSATGTGISFELT